MLVKVDRQVFLDPVKVGSVTFKETNLYTCADINPRVWCDLLFSYSMYVMVFIRKSLECHSQLQLQLQAYEVCAIHALSGFRPVEACLLVGVTVKAICECIARGAYLA